MIVMLYTLFLHNVFHASLLKIYISIGLLLFFMFRFILSNVLVKMLSDIFGNRVYLMCQDPPIPLPVVRNIHPAGQESKH